MTKMLQPDSVAQYLSEFKDVPLLSAKAEKALARDIASKDVALWAAMLSLPAATAPILALLEQEVFEAEDGKGEVLDRATVRALLKSTGAQRVELVEKLSRNVRDCDAERDWTRRCIRLALTFDDAAYCQRVDQANKAHLRAKERFVSANLRLVFMYARKAVRPGVELQDAIQAGNIGLMKAVEKFDPDKGFRFSTYATWWIRHHVGREVANHGRTVRHPVHLQTLAHSLSAATANFVAREGRSPTDKELAKLTGVKVHDVRKAARYDFGNALSLDRPFEDGSSHLDYVEADTESPDKGPSDEAAKAALQRLMWGLPPKEKAILCWRFGIDGEPLTLKEIGDKYGVSRERIRQLEVDGLRKLRRKAAQAGLSLAEFF